MESLGELRSLIARHTVPGANPAERGNVRLAASVTPTEPIGCVVEPAFAFVAQGAKRTVLGDRVLEYAQGQYLVASVELPVTGCVTRASQARPFLTVGLILQPAVIASLLLEAPAIRVDASDITSIAVSDMNDDLLDALVRLLRLLDRPGDAPILGGMIEREIHWRLLNGPQGAMVRQIGLADSRLSQIARTIQWIRGHYAEILRIEHLAELAGMSVSSFHRHFRAVTTMSPVQYQKQIRLQEARSRLISRTGDVAAVGFSVGYDSPSQFSREYRRHFGDSPSKDAVRIQVVSEVSERQSRAVKIPPGLP